MYYNASMIKGHIAAGHVKISPYIEKFQGPNLYYCHLGSSVLIPKAGSIADTKRLAKDLYEKQEIGDFYDLKPSEFILAETFETFSTDKRHIIRLFNSSSLARLGVVQCAVGMINPGCGIKTPVRLTLELTNTSPFTVRLYPTRLNGESGEIDDFGTEILKVAVAPHHEVDVAYEDWNGSVYGADSGVAGSKIDRRFQ